jgi:hypothetical protein
MRILKTLASALQKKKKPIAQIRVLTNSDGEKVYIVEAMDGNSDFLDITFPNGETLREKLPCDRESIGNRTPDEWKAWWNSLMDPHIDKL